MAAYERGDYAIAMRLLRPLAEQGNADAQNKLGHMVRMGRGRTARPCGRSIPATKQCSRLVVQERG
jgi:TPR repeat protein